MSSSHKRYHLLIDISNCSSEILNSPQRISEFLQRLAQLSEMQVLFGPQIIEGSSYNPGFTGLAVIDYSHIAVHTFPSSGAMFVDLFSCKPFPTSRILHYVKTTLAVDDSQLTVQTINLNEDKIHTLS